MTEAVAIEGEGETGESLRFRRAARFVAGGVSSRPLLRKEFVGGFKCPHFIQINSSEMLQYQVSMQGDGSAYGCRPARSHERDRYA